MEPYYNVKFEKYNGEIEIFTSNERFVLNSYKRNILKNAASFVPKIFFAFRPSYCIQLSCRFIMKLLTGSNDKNEISFLIQQNSQSLTRYFENIRIISEFVFTGGLTREPTPESENICQQVLMGLVEIFVAQNSKENEVVELNHNHLIAFRDSSSILSGNQAELVCNSDISRKFGKLELCMNGMDFICIICQQFYSTNLQLQEHIKEHTQHVCLPCNIEFTSYEGLLTHYLTFC